MTRIGHSSSNSNIGDLEIEILADSVDGAFNQNSQNLNLDRQRTRIIPISTLSSTFRENLKYGMLLNAIECYAIIFKSNSDVLEREKKLYFYRKNGYKLFFLH